MTSSSAGVRSCARVGYPSGRRPRNRFAGPRSVRHPTKPRGRHVGSSRRPGGCSGRREFGSGQSSNCRLRPSVLETAHGCRVRAPRTRPLFGPQVELLTRARYRNGLESVLPTVATLSAGTLGEDRNKQTIPCADEPAGWSGRGPVSMRASALAHYLRLLRTLRDRRFVPPVAAGHLVRGPRCDWDQALGPSGDRTILMLPMGQRRSGLILRALRCP